MRRSALPAFMLLLVVALLSPLAEAGPKPRQMVVRGRVTDLDGKGVSGVPVRVIATRRIARFLSIESKPAQAELARTVTDAAGFYEFHVSKAREYDYYFLRFYDSTGFDAVKFAVPDDVEITRLITRRRPVVVDQVLQHAPEWEAVQRLRSLYGPDSLRGKIVRDLGVPDRTERAFTDAGVERETWWFDAAGVAYVIEDGEVVDKREFQAEAESHSIANRQ